MKLWTRVLYSISFIYSDANKKEFPNVDGFTNVSCLGPFDQCINSLDQKVVKIIQLFFYFTPLRCFQLRPWRNINAQIPARFAGICSLASK